MDEGVLMDELFYASATALARRIRDRELSSEVVVQAHLQRIAAINPRLNAVVQLAATQALEDARAADAALARGQPPGALHGVPFSVKDWIDTAGLPLHRGRPGVPHPRAGPRCHGGCAYAPGRRYPAGQNQRDG